MSGASKSYSAGHSNTALLGQTIGEMFNASAEKYADNDALIVIHQNIRLNYRELKQAVDAAAKAFIAIGVKRGDRVGIWSPNCAEWVITQFATAKIGAILVNINPAYRSAELQHALMHSGTQVLITAEVFKASKYTEIIESLIPELKLAQASELNSEQLPALKHIVCLAETKHPGMTRWQDFINEASAVSDDALIALESELQFDDAINIQYTSGTTGRPKGATLSHHNILNNGFFVTESMNFSEADRLVIPVPLYHCFGMVMGNLGCISHGATMIYPDEGFDPLSVLKTVQAEKATALYGVPTMFIAMLEHERFAEFDLSSLRTGIMAGSICPAPVMKSVNSRMHMQEVQIAYGMTETSPVSTQTSARDPFDKQVTTVGRTQPHIESKIIDPANGKIVDRGVTGELCTRGYSVMLKYWNNDEATAEAIDQTGWMHTGDLATMDEDGFIQIVGRIKDMVIRGGENIYPKEIEEYLYQHPAIVDVQVIGIPDKKYGEELVAWIRLSNDADDVTEDTIRDYCKEGITHYKVPRYIRFVDEFPMTVTGKIQKFKMRKISIEEYALES